MQLDDLLWVLLLIVSGVFPTLLKEFLLRLTRKNRKPS